MQGLQYPEYLKEEGDGAVFDWQLSIIRSAKPQDFDLQVHSTINWLAQRKTLAIEASVLESIIRSSEIDTAWTYLRYCIRNHFPLVKQFEALLEFNSKFVNGLGPDSSAEQLLPYSTAYVLQQNISSELEEALVKLVQAQGQRDYWAVFYAGVFSTAGSIRLECCLDLAKAGIDSASLLKQFELNFFITSLETCLDKARLLLAMPTDSEVSLANKLDKLTWLRLKYLQELKDTYGSRSEELQYTEALKFYKLMWSQELPLEYLATTLAEIKEIYADAECYQSFAKAIFSVKHVEARELQVAAVMRVTESIWGSATTQEKCDWLRCLARYDDNMIMGNYLRQKLLSIEDKKMAPSAHSHVVGHFVAKQAASAVSPASSSTASL